MQARGHPPADRRTLQQGKAGTKRDAAVPALCHPLGKQLGDGVAGAGSGCGVERRAVVGRLNVNFGLVSDQQLQAVAGGRVRAGASTQGQR